MNPLLGGDGRVACALLVLLSLSAPPSSRSADGLSPAYEAAIRRYGSGDREGAIDEMATWPERVLRQDLRALQALSQAARACDRCPAADTWAKLPVRAALMLHSDCAQTARRNGQFPVLQESAAAEVARLMKGDPSLQGFARRWYEAMASLAEAEARWAEALAWAARGLREFPDSVELRLVQASVEETQGSLEETLGSPEALARGEALVDPNTRGSRADLLHRREVRERFENARRALREALAVDASLLEPRLRLGHVAYRLGETTEARSALQDLLARSPDRATAFLAHLFLGRLDEDAGRLDDAATSYEAAKAIDPLSQSAGIALSHLRLRRGDAAGARAEVERTVGAAGHRAQPDALWLYPWGPSVGVGERLAALRREATS